MKAMKKAILFLLALVLLLTAAATAGAEFYDEDSLPVKFRTAVDYAAGKGIISGFPDKTFKPNDKLTRAQAAKILCVALEGTAKANAVAAADTDFTDVPSTHWASGYVAYCAGKKIVAGMGDGRFDPEGQLSSAAFAKMMLVAYGHDPEAEGLVGAQWVENTQKSLKATGFDKDVGTIKTVAMSRAVACQLVYNFVRAAEEKEMGEMGYPFTTFELTNQQNFRVLGRAVYAQNGLICDFSSSGVEFTLDCAGTIWATLEVSDAIGTRFRAYVDGKPGEAITFSSQHPTQPLFSNIEAGVHTIRVVKDVPATGVVMTLQSISACAKPETIKPTAQRKYYIECIGDSITGGAGIYGPGPGNTNSSTSAMAYGVLTADLLNADYSLVCRGGIGLATKTDGVTMNELYDYENYYRDKETKYAFTRKPNAVVIALGANDKDETGWEDLMKKFISQVRSRYNDQSLKIVLIYNMMSDRHAAACEKIAKEDPLCWDLKLPRNNEGYGGHPNANAQLSYAMQLSILLKSIL
ncbi:MAG: S-layer homology domain-containing protein [Oscillospiraceae bacterium]|nr:S-layer homology domain-containing protein [Oscillospiraceae bacterium]